VIYKKNTIDFYWGEFVQRKKGEKLLGNSSNVQSLHLSYFMFKVTKAAIGIGSKRRLINIYN